MKDEVSKAMTVAELIELLKKYPQEYIVRMCMDIDELQLHDDLGDIADDKECIILLNKAFDHES